MINAVGREIPDEILRATGKEPFQGNNYKNGVPFRRQGPIIRPMMDNQHSKLVKDIHEALVKCRAHSGMTISFHHHFREGDLIVNMVMEEIHKMGLKNITLGYTIPEKITKYAGIKRLRVYASATDLFSISRFPKGWDPEMGYTSYPITMSLLMGLSVKF